VALSGNRSLPSRQQALRLALSQAPVIAEFRQEIERLADLAIA